MNRPHKRRSRLGLLLVGALAATLAMPVAASSETTDSGPKDPVSVALDHVVGNAAELGVSEADVAELRVTSSYTSEHNGVTHVNLNQTYQGLEVFGGAQATVNVGADGEVVYVGENLVAGLRDGASGSVDIEAVEAVEAAADTLDLDDPTDLRPMSTRSGATQETVLTDGGISLEPIPARLGWQPTEDGLRLAWQVVIDEASDDGELWNITVDAEIGEVLETESWTSENSLEGFESFLRRPGAPSSAASESLAAGAATSPNPVEDGSSYRVLELPKESPLDGPFTLVTEPADATASPFGWHDTTGTPEPDFTITQGNNVHAYTDRDASDGPDPGSEPDGGSNLTFDFEADLDEHPQNYTDAVVTNLFYWNNIIHDVAYLYGFDEASGNFQVNNYGRGGAGGDDVRAHAMSGAGHNNANFSTPAVDGGRPRMRMYLWPGYQFGLPNALTIASGDAAGTYLADYARFTPGATNAGTSGEVVLVDDGSDDPTAGCEPYALPAGSIALVDDLSGDIEDCNHYTQVANAEAAGASAVVVANVSGGASPGVLSGSMDPAVGIPAIRVSAADAATIKAGLPAPGTVRRNTDRPPIRDGDFEAGIIIHEYSHGISNRLTGGPTTNCLSGDQRMGEGWSDYHAIAALIDPELDDPQGPRGMGPYALFQDSREGNGIRPRPYSRNMNIQPFTYDMIKTGGWITGGSLAIPHGIGHGWAAILWDMTWDLIDQHGFNPNIYEDWSTGGNNLAYQLVMDGLKLQGCGPGFVDGRDAILAADDILTGGENQCLLWRTFARRGLGYDAIQGTTNRNDGDEGFALPPNCVRNQSRVDLLGENEPDGGDPDGSGGARISWDQSGRVCFDIRVRDIAPATAAHIHAGGHGVNGPIVVDFDTANNGLQGCVEGVDPALVQEIRTSPTQYYVNIHNAEYPGGALRAQLN